VAEDFHGAAQAALTGESLSHQLRADFRRGFRVKGRLPQQIDQTIKLLEQVFLDPLAR
jgi:acyl carrier protein phosphodiesterase